MPVKNEKFCPKKSVYDALALEIPEQRNVKRCRLLFIFSILTSEVWVSFNAVQ